MVLKMKLESFKEKNRKKQSIIIFTVSCVLLIVGVFFYQSFALFETKENFNFIEGNVNGPGDLYFVYYVDDQITLDVPTKESGYTLSSKSSCTNGVTIRWNNTTWTSILNYSNYKKENLSQVKCSLYFEKKLSVKEYLLTKGMKEQLIEDDGTVDHNMRYIGANPNNYIDIKDDYEKGETTLWRIIGIMNNVKKSSTDTVGEPRIKIVKADSIGSYSWDTTEESINLGKGINEWSEADLMKLLNPGYERESIGGSLYWNKGSGTCYNGQNNATTACDFSKSGLSNDAKRFVSSVLWNTGGNGSEATYRNVIPSKIYELERSSNTGRICTSGTNCNDTVNRNTNWEGIVGLIYPSDYGYATSGGTTTTRENCLQSYIFQWNEEQYQECKENSWLLNKIRSIWTLTPNATEINAQMIFRIDIDGHVGNGTAYGDYWVFPVIYLASDVYINGGNGSLENPFTVARD